MNSIESEIFTKAHPLKQWEEGEFDRKVKEMEEEMKTDLKLVIAYCIYEEEDFLFESLQNCLTINDFDAIHILDGAWKNGGNFYKSVDDTRKIIDDFKEDHPEIEVIYEHHPDKMIWRTQGEKRNYQLKRIEELFGKAYIMIKDGDEITKFTTGRNTIFLKYELKDKFPGIGIVKSYGVGSDNGMIGVRFIPTHQGIHYHTDRRMTVHNDRCKIVCDYNLEEQFILNRMCYEYDKIFYVNHWKIRNNPRLEQKNKYIEHVLKEGDKKCQFNT